MSNSEIVEGNVSSILVNDNDSDPDVMVYVSFVGSFNNVFMCKYLATASKYKIGDKVLVVYDKQNPTNCFKYSLSEYYLRPFLFLGGYLFVILGLYFRIDERI